MTGMDLYFSYVRIPQLTGVIFPFNSSDVLVPIIDFCLGMPSSGFNKSHFFPPSVCVSVCVCTCVFSLGVG